MINLGYDLVPEYPKEWDGKVFLFDKNEDKGTDVFGKTDLVLVNASKRIKLIVKNDKNEDRDFVYYLFRHNPCDETEVIMHPNSGHYYSFGIWDEYGKDGRKINETRESFNKCFYYILGSTQYKFTASTYGNSYYTTFYHTREIEEYYKIFDGIINETIEYSKAILVNCQTRYSAYGYTSFNFSTDEETGEFMRYDSRNFLNQEPEEIKAPMTELSPDDIHPYNSVTVVSIVSIWIIFVVLIVISITMKDKLLMQRLDSANKEIALQSLRSQQIQAQNNQQLQQNERIETIPNNPYGDVTIESRKEPTRESLIIYSQ